MNGKQLKVGDRCVFQDEPKQELLDGELREISPSGELIDLAQGRWHRAADVTVVEVLRPRVYPWSANGVVSSGVAKPIDQGPVALENKLGDVNTPPTPQP